MKKTKDYLSRVILKRGTVDQVVEEINVTVELMSCACKIGQSLAVYNLTMNKHAELSTTRKGITYLPATLKADITERYFDLKFPKKFVSWVFEKNM